MIIVGLIRESKFPGDPHVALTPAQWRWLKKKFTAHNLNTNVGLMAVGNLPNELPKDAICYFVEQLIIYIAGRSQWRKQSIRQGNHFEERKLYPMIRIFEKLRHWR